MRFVRYQLGNDQPRYGWVLEDRIGAMDGSPFGEYRRMEADLPISKVQLLAPLLPGKIIGVGINFVERARELGKEPPLVPEIFLKPPSAVVGQGERIVLPPQSKHVTHGVCLAIVIGKTGRWITPEKASGHILGYMAGNDITAHDLLEQDGQWTRAKSFDTFCPLGPWLETDFDPADALMTCRVSSELRQMSSTREMIFQIPQLVAFISSIMTLNPGDVILTGTPAGVSDLKTGDTVEASIEGIGSIMNPVKVT